jgi:Ulp1 protease family, C-terminal catalytic domain
MNLNIGNYSHICKDIANIEHSFEKGNIYTKTWDAQAHKLKELEGWDLFKAKVKYYFDFLSSTPYEEERFREIFTNCMDDHLNDGQKFSKTGDLSLDAKVFKGISHYLAYMKKELPDDDLSEDFEHFILSIEADIQNKRNVLSNKLAVGPNQRLSTDKLIENQRTIVELYNLENEYDEDSKKSKATLYRYRCAYTSHIQNLTFQAHENYLKNSNMETALDLVAQKIEDIQFFSDLSQSRDKNTREYALDLATCVKYGFDAAEIRSGQTTPNTFWDIQRIWNTFKGKETDKFIPDDYVEKFENLSVPDQKLVKNLLNNPNDEMGDRLLEVYTQKTLPAEYPNAPFESRYLALPPNRKYADIVPHLKGASFFGSKDKNFLFVPFVFKPANPLFPDHIVLIIFDRKARQIQYYDPQALPPDHPDRQADGFNMLDKLNELKDFWNEKEKSFGRAQDIEIVRNPMIHQEDIHNCGIYICDAIRRILLGESFEHLCIEGKNIEQITRVRSSLAHEIIQHQPIEEVSDKTHDNGIINLVKDEMNSNGADGKSYEGFDLI